MKELLVPVGNMDSLVVAIKSGADAVYLAGKNMVREQVLLIFLMRK